MPGCVRTGERQEGVLVA